MVSAEEIYRFYDFFDVKITCRIWGELLLHESYKWHVSPLPGRLSLNEHFTIPFLPVGDFLSDRSS